MKVQWVLYLARRYFKSKRKSRGLAPSVLSVAGIAVGVLTLITVLGVMNGFQLGFIDDILSISSYHLRIDAPTPPMTDAQLDRLRSLPGIQAVVPFREVQTLMSSVASPFVAAVVRGVPADAATLDPDLAAHVHLVDGSFSFPSDRTIVLGIELAHALGVHVGDEVSVVSLAGKSFNALNPESVSFAVGGIYKSGYYEFDQSLCFVDLPASAALSSASENLVYGVKLADRFRDAEAIRRIEEAFPGLHFHIESWRTFNSAFFGALKMEKLVMMLLLCLIFVVVAVNISHFLQRTVFERREEIGILRSLGASPLAVQAVFIFDGLYIGILGGGIGILLGLFISDHINAIFAFLELVINVGVAAVGALLSPVGAVPQPVGLSPSAFYMDAIPSRVLFHEALLIFLFGVIASVGAAYLASRHAASIKPREVLRYE